MTVMSRFSIALMLSAAGLAYLMYSPASDEPSSLTSATSGQIANKEGAEPSFDLPTASQYPTAARIRASVFDVDRNGNLVIDHNTTGKMDVLLAGLPPQASVQDMQRIEDLAKAGLPDGASRKALRILHDYIAYRKAEAALSLQAQPVNAAGVQDMLSRLIALRRLHLGQEAADALFAVQDAQARVGMETARIEADASLSPREKALRIAALQKTLPAGAAGEGPDADAQAALALAEQVAALRQRGAPESDVQRLRERQLGVEGAQHLHDMESQKNQWDQRFQEFSRQKNVILSAAISEQQKQENVEALLRQHYTQQEIDTVRAYDRGNSPR